MKNALIVIICLALLLSFTACTQQPEETTVTTEAPTETTEATTPTETITISNEKSPLISASLPAITETYLAQDETLIFSYTYQNLSLIHPDQLVAEAIIVDFLNRVDEANTASVSYLEQAQNAYTGNSSWVPYQYSVTYSPMRIDRGVLSLYGNVALYTGGIHPEHSGICANYDMVTGDVLTLASILTGSEKAAEVAELAVEVLTEAKEELDIYTGFESIVRQNITTDPTRNENWYFSANGLCFYFAPYEIAPYASGTVVAEIPYEKLVGLLYDGYYPAEKDLTSGNVSADRVTGTLGDENAEFPYSEVAEVIIDKGGEQIALYTDGKLLNVRLEVGQWDTDGVVFIPAYTAFACESLCAGDAILLETYIPDVMPNIRLSYISENAESYVFITQSGEDGSIILYQ